MATRTAVMTVSEVARALGISAETVRQWADAGKLPMQKTTAGTRIFQRVDVDKLRRSRAGAEARRG
jgi:excisionase family DNA binding protein